MPEQGHSHDQPATGYYRCYRGGRRPSRRAVEQDNTISLATVYRTVKLLEEAGVIERLEFGDGRARYEEAGEHHEHLVDVETGDVIEFYHAELEALKEQVAREMGYELVDHRLELFGRKLKKD